MCNIAEELFQELYKQYSEKDYVYEYRHYLELVYNEGTKIFDVPLGFCTNEMIMTSIETPHSPLHLLSRWEFEELYRRKVYKPSVVETPQSIARDEEEKDRYLGSLRSIIDLQYDKYLHYDGDLIVKKYYTFLDFFETVSEHYGGMDAVSYLYLYRGYPIPIIIGKGGRSNYYMLIYAEKNRTLNLVKITASAYKTLWSNLSIKLDNYYKDASHLDEYFWEEKSSFLTKIPILQDGIYYDVYSTDEENGVIYDSHHCNILGVPEGIEEFVIPEGVRTIPPKCFKGNHNLKKVTIPSSLLEIPESAFMDCVSLEEVDLSAIEGGYTRMNVASAAFCNCKSLKHIDMSKLEIRGGNIVFAFTGIETLDGIRCYLINKGTMTFYHCCNLKKLPDEAYSSTSDYGEFGLACCTSLTSVNLRFHDVPRGLFYGCSNLEEVCIKDENYFKIKINPYAFEGCEKITKIVFPRASVDIAEYAFKNCHSLSLLSLSKEDQWDSEIAANAFEGCGNIKIEWVKKEKFKLEYQSISDDYYL